MSRSSRGVSPADLVESGELAWYGPVTEQYRMGDYFPGVSWEARATRDETVLRLESAYLGQDHDGVGLELDGRVMIGRGRRPRPPVKPWSGK